MNTTYLIYIGVALALIILGAIGLPLLFRNLRSKKLKEHFGPEYDLAVQTLGDKEKARKELEERRRHVETLDIHPLTASQRERYLAEWEAVQSKFVDEPGLAIEDADRLIIEVMQLRSYPIEDFEQRAADLSVHYPELVSNYRAARAIVVKNAAKQAQTEELRQALIYFRSLFEELLEVEPVPA